MAKFDKELMKKHHFWLLFAPIGLFILIAWYMLMFDVPGEIQGTQAKHEEKKKALAASQKVLPRKALDKYGEQIVDLDKQRDDIWKKGWNDQKHLFTWPGENDKDRRTGYTPEQLEVLKDRKFGEEIPEQPGAVRDQFRADKVYPAEYRNLVKLVEPLQFRDTWDKTLRYFSFPNVPSSEDMWLAMEDYWIQREILLALHQVNVNAATFEPQKKGTDDPLHRVFKSRFWEIDIRLVDVKGKLTVQADLTNVSERLQVMGVGNVMKLEVDLSGKPFIFEVQGDPVESGAKVAVKPLLKHALTPEFKPKSIDGVKQLFDARTVPVKRLDNMKLGKVCDRFRNVPLKMAQFSRDIAKKEAPAPTTGGAAPPPTTGDGTNPEGGEGGVATPPPATNSPDAGLPTLSQNGLPRRRYIEATDQIRIFPLGFVVTTDQAFMKDIMEELLKSSKDYKKEPRDRLRFQMTQVDWIRFHGSLNYEPGNAGTASGAGGEGGRPPVGGEGGRPAPGGGTSGPTNSRDDQFSANLMELTIYGLVSMYEKFPEDKPTPKKK